MKKVKLLIPALSKTPFTIFLPDLSFNNLTYPQIILKLSVYLSTTILFLLSLLLPLINLFNMNSLAVGSSFLNYFGNDSLIFRYIIFIDFVLLALFVISLIFNKRRLIDPDSFMYVLIFALIATSSSVFTSSLSSLNTFGANLRVFSGLAVIVYVTFFYVITTIIRDIKILKNLINYLTIGNILALIVLVYQSTQYPDFIKTTLPLAIISFSFLVSKILLEIRGKKIGYAILTIILILLSISSFNLKPADQISLFIIMLVSLISTLIIYITYILNDIKEVSERLNKIIYNLNIKKIKENKFYTADVISDFVYIILFILPFLIGIGMLGLLIIQVRSNSPAMQVYIQKEIINVYSNIFKSLNGNSLIFNFSNWRSILFGLGSTGVTLTPSLFSNILSSLGVFGCISYGFISIYAIRLAIRLFIRKMSDRSPLKLIISLVFSVIFIPILSLVVYPGIYLVIIWWLSFTLLSIYENIIKDNKENVINEDSLEINELVIRNNKISKNINYLIRLILSLIVVLILILVLNQIGIYVV